MHFLRHLICKKPYKYLRRNCAIFITDKTSREHTCADIFRTSEFVSAQRGRYIITLSPKHKASRLGNTNAAGIENKKKYIIKSMAMRFVPKLSKTLNHLPKSQVT